MSCPIRVDADPTADAVHRRHGYGDRMPSFASYDESEVHYSLFGVPTHAVICLPGGPLRSTRYLGNLGGLDAHIALLLVELPHRRVDRIVGDIEALRVHLDRDRLDIVAHSASASLALLYASAHPDRVNRVALITPGTRRCRDTTF